MHVTEEQQVNSRRGEGSLVPRPSSKEETPFPLAVLKGGLGTRLGGGVSSTVDAH